jgi:hydroxyacylglutathione hydrolase
MNAARTTIVPLPLGGVNAYLLRRGDRAVLIDTGLPGQSDAILKALATRGIAKREIGLILLTHADPDHSGGAATLRERLGVPVAVHTAEAARLRTGELGNPRPLRLPGHILMRVVPKEVAPCEPDVVIDGETDLGRYGVDGVVVPTPGHSPGSVSILLPSGGCVAGDLLAGGFVRRNRPDYPFFADDPDLLRQSLAALLRRSPVRLFFGHGLPADIASVRRHFAADLPADLAEIGAAR